MLSLQAPEVGTCLFFVRLTGHQEPHQTPRIAQLSPSLNVLGVVSTLEGIIRDRGLKLDRSIVSAKELVLEDLNLIVATPLGLRNVEDGARFLLVPSSIVIFQLSLENNDLR